MAGRTSWWAKDAAWHRRELQVELGETFGAEGPMVLDVLSCWAQEQKSSGDVRGGFRTLAREAFVTVGHAQSIVEYAATIGALDDLEIDDDGRRFSCRVSGFRADQQRGHAALRKATQRELEAAETTGLSVTGRDTSRPVTDSRLPDQTRQLKEETSSPLVEATGLDAAEGRGDVVNRLFAYWQQKCNHTSARLTRDRRGKIEARLREGYTEQQVQQAIDGAARGAFVNDQGKRFDDIELICRNGSKLEDFLDRAAPGPRSAPSNGTPHDLTRRRRALALAAEQGDQHAAAEYERLTGSAA